MLLVGGLGTRLRSVVPSTPKPLAAVGGQSFLELLVRQLRNQGITNLVMCTGYLGEQVQSEFGDGRSWGVAIEYSQEMSPLGTAGAVKLAQAYLRDVPEFLVMNGDSFLEIDFDRADSISSRTWRVGQYGCFGSRQRGSIRDSEDGSSRAGDRFLREDGMRSLGCCQRGRLCFQSCGA